MLSRPRLVPHRKPIRPDCFSYRLVRSRRRQAHFRSGRRRRRHGRRRRRSRRRSRSRRKPRVPGQPNDAAAMAMATSGPAALAGILISVLHSFSGRALPRRCPFPLRWLFPVSGGLNAGYGKRPETRRPPRLEPDGRVCGYVHVRRYADVHVFHCASVRMRNCVCVRVCVCAIAEPTGAYRNRACPDPGECCRS